MIKTWNQRCDEHPDHQGRIVTHSMIDARKQEEIDELRAKLEALETQEPVGQVIPIGVTRLPEFQWLSADHSFRVAIGDKLYLAAGAVEPSSTPDFETWWAAQIALNGGHLGAEYRHWARAGWIAAGAVGQPARSCEWTLDDEDSNTWKSSCGELWSFIEGGPKENRVTYCHHCGKPASIKEAP